MAKLSIEDFIEELYDILPEGQQYDDPSLLSEQSKVSVKRAIRLGILESRGMYLKLTVEARKFITGVRSESFTGTWLDWLRKNQPKDKKGRLKVKIPKNDLRINKRLVGYEDLKPAGYYDRVENLRPSNTSNYAANVRRYTERRMKLDLEYASFIRSHRKKDSEYIRDRRKNFPHVRFSGNLRGRICTALKGNVEKSASTEELLGCTFDEARAHIESQFLPGMTWDNHGVDGWHIDHIQPCASFDLTDPEQQRACFHYTNLQPLWAEDNLAKSDTDYAEWVLNS